MKDFNKGKKGQICQLIEPISQTKQWISLDDIIIYPNGKPIKLGSYLNDLEHKVINLELALNKANDEIITCNQIELKTNESIEILLKKYEKLNNSVETLLSLNNVKK